MFETISRETRWFLPGNRVKPIVAWFGSLASPQHMDDNQDFPRQDYYLKMPGVENLGIKIREPKQDQATGKIKSLLEVKRMVSEKEQFEFAGSNNGYTAKWQKLSYELTERGDDLVLINPLIPSSGNTWVRVDKDRILAKYDAKNKSIVDGSTDIGEACGIELAKIKVNNSVHYSFGLEAMSKSGKNLEKNFYDCCDLVFDQIGLTGLTLFTSLSYPEFLVKMI